jgi:hypothetical protein
MASSPVAALRNARLPPLSPPRVAGGARPAPAAPLRTPPPASVLSLPIFSPPKWAFLVSYANMRLTVPTLLAWLACITFHYACTLCVLGAWGPRLWSPALSLCSPHPPHTHTHPAQPHS